jgi:hypothetical protein
MESDTLSEYKTALGLPVEKFTCLAWLKRKERPCNKALGKRANNRIEATIRAIFDKGSVSNLATLTGGDNISDPLKSLAESLVCSRSHARKFEKGNTFFTAQVDYVATVLAEKLVAWVEVTATRVEAAEKQTVASARCQDMPITPAKSTISGTQRPKVLLEGPHTNGIGTDLGSDSSEGTSSTSNRQTSTAKLGHLSHSTPTRESNLPSPPSISATTPSDSVFESEFEFSSPLTPHTPTTAGSKTESYFPTAHRRDPRSYAEESPTRERSTRSSHITLNVASDIQDSTSTDSEKGSEESDDEFYTPKCEPGPEKHSQDGNKPLFKSKADDQDTLHPPKPKKGRRASAPESAALRSEGSNRLDIPTAEPAYRGHRGTHSAHKPRTTSKHSRNGSPGLNPRGIVFDSADDDENGAPSLGTEKTYPLEFEPPQCKKSVKNILKTMWTPAVGDTLRAGFIYCYVDKFTPGYVKIGYTAIANTSEKHSDPQKLPSAEGEDRHVGERLNWWRNECGRQIDLQFATFMPCAAKQMETLIHTTLHNEKRIVVNCICKRNHIEWFHISVDEARAVVEEWRKFSGLRPYCQEGNAEPFWYNFAVSNHRLFENLNPRKWLGEHLSREISREARRKRMEELEKRMKSSQKKTHLAQLTLEGAEARLSALKSKEKSIEQELEALKKIV